MTSTIAVPEPEGYAPDAERPWIRAADFGRSLRCLRCGARARIPLSFDRSHYHEAVSSFVTEHRSCEPAA